MVAHNDDEVSVHNLDSNPWSHPHWQRKVSSNKWKHLLDAITKNESESKLSLNEQVRQKKFIEDGKTIPLMDRISFLSII